MSTTKVSQDKQHRFQRFVAQGVQEAALILLVVLCLYVLLSLISYNPQDPGWNYAGPDTRATNVTGLVGAYVASVLIVAFGHAAYFFPILLGYRAWQVFLRRHQPSQFHWPLFLVRVLGFVLVMISATGLLAMYSIFGSGPDSGGALGAEISGGFLSRFNLLGGTLLLVALFLIGVTVFTGLSWLWLMDRLGSLTLRLAVFSRNKTQNLLDRWRDKKAVRADKPEPVVINKPKATGPVLEKRSRLSRWLGKVLPGRKSARSDRPRNEPAVSLEPNIPLLEQQAPQSSAVEAKSEAQVNTSSKIKISPFKKKKEEPSKRAQQEGQPSLFDFDKGPLPSIGLLDPPIKEKKAGGYTAEQLENLSRLLEEKLKDFGVTVKVVEVNPGPVITRFEIQPAPGVKVSRITNLAKDLARSLAVQSVRVVEVIPGKSVVGIEIPNEQRDVVRLSEVLYSKAYDESDSPLTLALGNDIGGNPVTANLAKMPHLLVAGTTGSGKSVGVNAMLLSMLLKATPDQLRLIMVDPKMLELSIYDGIPHLLAPVVTDMKEAANALRWCVAEMERRYRLMAAMGVRNIAGFNRKVTDAIEAGEPIKDPIWKPDEMLENDESDRPDLESLPFIVVVIDEFADMMMIVGKKVEELIARIAQKARAAGIHLILATQRPSVDVITGLIKANIPTRMSFQVSSKIDSRTVLDQGGAEQLLGHGDMLYMPPGTSLPMRVHGAFVADDEVHRVVKDWKERGEPDYLDEVVSGGEGDGIPGLVPSGGDGDSEQDALYDEAVAFVTESRRASISAVQRKLKIGYNRAANLVEAMEAAGVVSSAGHNGAREVLAPPPPKD